MNRSDEPEMYGGGWKVVLAGTAWLSTTVYSLSVKYGCDLAGLYGLQVFRLSGLRASIFCVGLRCVLRNTLSSPEWSGRTGLLWVRRAGCVCGYSQMIYLLTCILRNMYIRANLHAK